MKVDHQTFRIRTSGKGLYECTAEVQKKVQGDVREGICTVFVQHTSASLIIQENADPSARYDLEQWIDRLIPDGDPAYTHVYEGPDDMPAHLKASITGSSLVIPVQGGKLALGTWQGLYLWEHRVQPQQRSLLVTVLGV